MDIELARTFLEIVATGSFIRAAQRLHVTQTTVSARIRSLEDQLGRRVFVRNKAGASLTPAGEEFLRYAPALVQIWERARHQVAVPPGRRTVLAIGGELSLWDPFLLRWLLWMKAEAPDVALRAQVGLPEGLMRRIAEGVLDIAVMYAPQILPGLRVEQLFEERLVMVTANKRARKRKGDDGYVFVDWGPDFTMQHNLRLPDLANPGVVVGLGPLGLGYILAAGGSGYFRRRAVRPHVDSGRLRLVKGAPEFRHPAYVVYAEGADRSVLDPALRGLRHAAAAEREGAAGSG
ncbi:MAG: LysR family transcriptional regulator [Dongiaceae bacterium]